MSDFAIDPYLTKYPRGTFNGAPYLVKWEKENADLLRENIVNTIIKAVCHIKCVSARTCARACECVCMFCMRVCM